MMDVRQEKAWKAHGLECRVLWCETHYCGYAAVTKKNPAFHLSYDDVPVSVHGGLTYAGPTLQTEPKNNRDEVWFGFDCAHSGDYVKYAGIGVMGSERDDHKWTLFEVVAETESMAKQLKEMTWKKIVKQKLDYGPDWFKKRVAIKC